jgi:gamma-glutamylaminecyclotransferase
MSDKFGWDNNFGNSDAELRTIPVYVYGTLKAGYSNHRYLRRAKFIGPAISVDDNYLMQDVGFPVLWQKSDGYDLPELQGQVVGEVYVVNSQQLANCDRLEGNGRMYTRQERQFKITGRGGEVVTAWVYLWNLDRDHDEIAPVDGLLVWDREGKRKVA